MLEKLLDHNSLGSKDQIKQVLKLLEVKSYSKVDLKYICSTTDYQFNKSFDGVISLLSWLEVIELADVISINKKNIVFGCWPISGDYGIKHNKNSLILIKKAIDLGIYEFDTAPNYGAGNSEKLLGQLDKKYKKSNFRNWN